MTRSEERRALTQQRAPTAGPPVQASLPGPLVRTEERSTNRHIAVGAAAGALVGVCVAGPPGACIGGAVAACVAAGINRRREVAVEVWPYGIQSIDIPANAIKMEGSVMLFAVDVFPVGDIPPWRIWRRYNWFDMLRSAVGKRFLRRVPEPFPPKHFRTVFGQRLEQRRYMLKRWLEGVLRASTQVNGAVRYIRPFLEYAREPRPAPNQASTDRGSPGRNLQASPPPCSNSIGGGELLLRITVPSWATPGSQLQVTAPDGRLFSVTVPRRCRPGSELTISVPNSLSAAPALANSSSTVLGSTVCSTTAGSGSTLNAASVASNPAVSSSSGQQQSPLPTPGSPSAGPQRLCIQIPAGATPGQVIGVNVPGGRQLPMYVPWFATPGRNLEVVYDPMALTVVPLPAGEASSPEVGQGQACQKEEKEDKEPQLLQVQVPPGVQQGGVFAVEVPDGRRIPVTVPQGADLGATLAFMYNANSGELTPVQDDA